MKNPSKFLSFRSSGMWRKPSHKEFVRILWFFIFVYLNGGGSCADATQVWVKLYDIPNNCVFDMVERLLLLFRGRNQRLIISRSHMKAHHLISSRKVPPLLIRPNYRMYFLIVLLSGIRPSSIYCCYSNGQTEENFEKWIRNRIGYTSDTRMEVTTFTCTAGKLY